MENRQKKEEIILGINYGTSNISIITLSSKKSSIITNKDGEFIFPSNIILFNNIINLCNNEDIYVRLEKNEDNIIYDLKRLIGLNYKELIKKDYHKNLFYEIKEINNMPKIKIKNNKEDLYYS